MSSWSITINVTSEDVLMKMKLSYHLVAETVCWFCRADRTFAFLPGCGKPKKNKNSLHIHYSPRAMSENEPLFREEVYRVVSWNPL